MSNSIAPASTNELKLQFPAGNQIKDVIQLAAWFGTLGSRCRNGWGSLHFRGYATTQLQRQLDGFPEAHWLAVPWSLIESDGNTLNTDKLESALRPFYPESENRPGFLGGRAWELLSRELKIDGQRFFMPNGGVLYPALFVLPERANAASKTLRPFKQTREEGYRCSLCGEREWLTPDKADLTRPAGGNTAPKRKAVLWQGLPLSWSRRDEKGRGKEQLCALCTLKRLWPTLLVRFLAHCVSVQPMVPTDGCHESPQRLEYVPIRDDR